MIVLLCFTHEDRPLERYAQQKRPRPMRGMPCVDVGHADLELGDGVFITSEIDFSSVENVDRQVGRIVCTLKESKQLEKTILIFTSDHGLALGGP